MLPRRRAVSLGIFGLVTLCLFMPASASAQTSLAVFEPVPDTPGVVVRAARERTVAAHDAATLRATRDAAPWFSSRLIL